MATVIDMPHDDDQILSHILSFEQHVFLSSMNFRYRTPLQKTYYKEMIKIESESTRGAFIVISFSFCLSISSIFTINMPVISPCIFFLGVVISGIRLYGFESEMIRAALALWLFILISTFAVLSIHHPNTMMAYLAIFLVFPIIIRTHTCMINFALIPFSIWFIYREYQYDPIMTPPYLASLFIGLFVAVNNESVYRRGFLEKQFRIRSEDLLRRKQDSLLQLQAQESLGNRRLQHLIKNVLIGATRLLDTSVELSDADRKVCANLKTTFDFIMQWSAFSALAAGNYKPKQVHVKFSDFFRDLPIPHFVECLPVDDILKVKDSGGRFETFILTCALVDSVANAISHGEGPVRLKYWLDTNLGFLVVGVYNNLKTNALLLTPDRVEELFLEAHTNSGRGLSSVRFMLQAVGGDTELSMTSTEEVECLLKIPVFEIRLHQKNPGIKLHPPGALLPITAVSETGNFSRPNQLLERRTKNIYMETVEEKPIQVIFN